MIIKIDSTIKEQTDLLCGFVLEDSDTVLGFKKFNIDITLPIKQSIKDMKGKLSSLSLIPNPDDNHYNRILIAGLGKDANLTNDTVRMVSGKVAQKVKELELEKFSIILPTIYNSLDQVSAITQIVEGTKMAMYKFNRFKTMQKRRNLPELTIITNEVEKAEQVTKIAKITADGAIFAKNIGNLPPNECSPMTLSILAKKISEQQGINCKVISKLELREKGFGGITAVGQGSRNEPKLIILEYMNGPKDEKPIVLVGKAVTFDTGGISLKPGEKMNEMKFDKCGGCTVLGIMKAVSELKLSRNIVGIIPSVENMPSGESYRPGDIIKLYSGKTAEILNTDAEGRLILADAISYGEKYYSPKAIIDFATLTGACIVALGANVAGMISSNSALSTKIRESSKRTSEEIWELPLNQDYMNMIKSDVADMKNLGMGKAAGTITAAAFLRNAILKDTPWVHIDIAGVAWTQAGTREKSYNPKGATGFGVRLILDYLQNLN